MNFLINNEFNYFINVFLAFNGLGVALQSSNSGIAVIGSGLEIAPASDIAGGEMVVIDAITATEYKTKVMADMLKAVGFQKKALVVLEEKNDCVYKSLSNIAGVKIAYVNTLNVYDILNCNLFVVAKGAAEKMQEVYA
mgnify:CR=1 FL=1